MLARLSCQNEHNVPERPSLQRKCMCIGYLINPMFTVGIIAVLTRIFSFVGYNFHYNLML